MSLRSVASAAVIALALVASGCKSGKMRFNAVNPSTGRMGGGEEVRITGGGFEKLGNLEVRIGGRPAQNVGVLGDETIVLTTPEGREADANRPLDISILTSDGKSIVLRGAFTYRPGQGQGPAGPNEELRRRM